LVNQDLIRKISVPAQERRALLPDRKGHSTLVVILPKGLDALSSINEDAGRLIEQLVTGAVSKQFLKVALGQLAKHTPGMVRRLNKR
jgi:hypothetical protein